jgi:hypothetical protein
MLSRRVVVLLPALLALPACTETVAEFSAAGPPRASAGGTTVALILDNAPASLRARLAAALAEQALRRDIQLVQGQSNPRFSVRAHVAALSGEGGRNQLAWALDIFDAARARAGRVAGEEPLGSGGDPEQAVTDADLQKLAAKGLDDLAAFLSASAGQPVAAGRGASPGRAAVGASART